MKSVIELSNVTKDYHGVIGVEGVDLTVRRGSVFGFLGPNGSGKSTTINMLTDLIRPSHGAITVLGKDSHRDSLWIRRHIGFLVITMSIMLVAGLILFNKRDIYQR
jgi:ABC-2 type transport system ATP-binding protein